MEHKIKVLILEDLTSDAELAEREIKAVLNNYKTVVTDTEQGFIKALENFKPDLVISDYMLPTFNGMKALQITRKKEEFIPFIILTGSMNEETAVECMKAGADDYVIKEHIRRLGPAVISALDKNKIRQERKQAEEALKESEEKYRKIFENVQDIFYQVDTEGNIIEISPSIKRYSGYSREELIGIPVSRTYYNPNDRLLLIAELQKKGEVVDYEIRLKTKFDRFIYVSLNAHILYDENKKPAGIEGSLRDITERKQAEEKLKESEERFNLAMKSSNDGLFDWNLLTNEIYYSPAWKKMIGFEDHELPNDFSVWENATAPEDVKKSWELQQKLISKQIDRFVIEFKMKHKDGHWVDILSRARAYFNDKGKAIRMVGTHTDITERKKNKEALKEAHSNLQALLDNRKDSIWALDRNYNFIVFNKPYADTIYSNMGIQLEKGMNALEIHPQEVNDFWKPKFDEVFEGKYVTFEFSYVLDGKEHFFEVYMNPIYTDNKVSGLSALSMDITPRKHAEKELTKLSTAVKQSPSVIAITDTEGKLEYVNPKFTEITGYSLEEVIGQNSRILKSGEQPYEMYKELWETISSGKIWRGEFHNKKKNGEFFWEMALVSPIFDEQGKIINYIKVAEDITKQKRNEQIQTIIHHISNDVITSHNLKDFLFLVKDELGKLIDTSNFFIAIYNDATDRISLPFHHDEKDKWKSYPAEKTMTNYVIKTGKPLLAKKAMIEKLIKSGEVEQVGHLSKVWLGVPLKNENKVTGLLAVQSYDNENAYDEADVKMLEIISYQISLSLERLKAEEDLKLAKEKAEESNRLKTAFLNNMSHEIRTPLNGITGFIGLLQDSEIDDEQKQEFFDIINKSSNRLITTVTDIIDISRIEAGEVKILKSEVSANEILEEQYNFFYHQAKFKGIELYYKPSLSDSESRIITDKYKLEGILTNLIKNAIKFTEQGKIEFGCHRKKEKDTEVLEFYVEDTGIGIPQNRIHAVFNRFEKADIEDTKVFEGSGLGLAISKSYVEMLGGKISVKSKEGEDSTFTFSIPYTKQLVKESDVKQNINTEPQTSLSHLSLIIVEDDEVSRLFLQTILENKFNKVIYTATGKEAIDKCRENPQTDIILMDIKMPDMNGYDATREIRKFNKDVVIIAQTAFGLSGDREKAIEAGCDDYIAKPIKKEELFEKIIDCVNNKNS